MAAELNQIETHYSPRACLQGLKRIEKFIGRAPTYRNGPRVLDLDLIFYGTVSVKDVFGDPEAQDGVGWLECPHPRIAEREFVLRPLAE